MKIFLLCFLLVVPCFVFGQTADRIERLLGQDKVSYRDAALLVLEASGRLESARQASADEAFSFAMGRGWLPPGAEANGDAMLNGFSLLVMQAFEIDGGYLYSFFKNPHYAYRAMVYRGIIQGRADPQMFVSGDLLLYTVNRVMNREQLIMNKGRRAFLTLLFTLFSFFFANQLFAVDVGLVLDQNAIVSGTDGDAGFGYNGIFIPRITGLIGDAGDFYISGGINYKSDPWSLVPELLRTDFSWCTGSMDFNVGRMAYDDPLGYVASGLFDGARFSQYTEIGTFSAGAWYTGLLYKERAKIEMTENEYTAYKAAIDWNDFSNTYYAPRRFLAAVDWEHKGLLEKAIVKLSLLGQFDIPDQSY